VCQQSVGLLQRGLDEAGMATVSITQVPEIAEMVKPSLSCFVAMPFGLVLGDVGDQATHEAMVRAVLEEAYREHPAGSIVPLPFRWDRDDLRARQLRKEAL
jgi:D-proline reductase (dithiol) PrdB